MERYQWLMTEEAQEAVADPAERAAVADALADADCSSFGTAKLCLAQPEIALSLSNALDLSVSYERDLLVATAGGPTIAQVESVRDLRRLD